ncbi:GSTA3 transferase, partial [Polypterus senegalus]
MSCLSLVSHHGQPPVASPRHTNCIVRYRGRGPQAGTEDEVGGPLWFWGGIPILAGNAGTWLACSTGHQTVPVYHQVVLGHHYKAHGVRKGHRVRSSPSLCVPLQFDEVLLKSRAQYLQMVKDGLMMFEQVPLVEVDGMRLVQSRAILNYIAGKYDMNGSNLKERATIDMYVEGIRDLTDIIIRQPFLPDAERDANLDLINRRATKRYFPVFEKALAQGGKDFLVGSKMSLADVQLFEAILMVEEKVPSVLDPFPQLQAFKKHLELVPTIKKFLQPGSKRKPPPDEHYVKNVKEILDF